MDNEPETLLRVAGDIADGKQVNWSDEAVTNKHLATKLAQLKSLQEIGAAHLTLEESVVPDREVAGERTMSTWTTQTIDPPAPHPRQWGHLQILDLLGTGGVGDVFRAHDPNLQKDVALKLPRIDREDRATARRFIEEARRLAKVEHPNVLKIYGVDEHDGRVGLWTELVEGQTLEEQLQTQGPMSADEAGHVGTQICHALAAVHNAGLIHRDVKTANIMRKKGGGYILMDFSAVAEMLPGLNQAGDLPLSGTPYFMAPELFQGKSASVASDIYGLGVVLYRLVTGKFPVEGHSVEDLRNKHAGGESVPLQDVRSDLPASFVRVAEKALAADVEHERFRSAGAMEGAILTAMGEVLPPIAPPLPWWRRSEAIPILAVSLVAVVALGYWFVQFLGPSDLDVQVALFRLGPGVEERLMPGGRIEAGDQLFLEIAGTSDMYIYILNEDAAGHAYVLFPLPGVEFQNPLTAGIMHRLPGPLDGEERFWEVTFGAGKETILLVASSHPLTTLQEQMASLPRAGESMTSEISSDEIIPELRGIGGLTSRPAEGGGILSEHLVQLHHRALRSRFSAKRDSILADSAG